MENLKEKKGLVGMQSVLKFGRYKGHSIEQMLDERDHECVHYLMWLARELKVEYTEEVQTELSWQNAYVPKQSYNKAKYWGYTYSFN